MTPRDVKPLRAASCFSGIGGAELALPEADWLWCAEIEKFPSAVLATRFGHPNLGDITAPDFIDRALAFGPLDLLAGGPPCQAFSVAGLRKGMSDPRGQLSIRFLEIAHAIRPRNLLVENVPGWLNHEDNAFGCFLGGLVGADDALLPSERPRGKRENEFWRWHKDRREMVPRWPDAGMVAGPWGRAAWRVLDAQYAGLAQRRERVFLVADFGEGADPASVLFERRSLHGASPPRRETGEGITHDLAPCLTSSGRGTERTGQTRGQDPVIAVPIGFGGGNTSGPIDVAACEQWAVRRLTVRECERLQGFPDGWTLIETDKRRTVDEDEATYLAAQGAHVVRGNDGKLRTNAAADGPRYKALGNAWAVACVRPIAQRIAAKQMEMF